MNRCHDASVFYMFDAMLYVGVYLQMAVTVESGSWRLVLERGCLVRVRL